MSSSQTFSAQTAINMQAAINTLSKDLNNFSNLSNPTSSDISQIQQDVVSYYTAQIGERGYAGLAAAVAGNSDYNGSVAIQNIENFYGDSSYGKNEAIVAASLAKQDWSNITQSGQISVDDGQPIFVPTIADDALEHAQVFSDLNIPLTYWSGSIFAVANVNWMGSAATPYELDGVSQSSVFPSLAASDTLYSFTHLLTAVVQSDFQNAPTPSYFEERALRRHCVWKLRS